MPARCLLPPLGSPEPPGGAAHTTAFSLGSTFKLEGLRDLPQNSGGSIAPQTTSILPLPPPAGHRPLMGSEGARGLRDGIEVLLRQQDVVEVREQALGRWQRSHNSPVLSVHPSPDS